jgi:hypothetical protein
VRKILSIVIALGLVLALGVAMPAAAQNTCNGTVEMTNDCAGEEATYTINFTVPVTLTPGNDLLSFTFGAGTSLADVGDVDITVNATPVTGSVKAAEHIEFPVPAGLGFVMAGTNLTVVIDDVVNPAGGTYNLTLDYKLVCCDAEDFCTIEYTIRPAEAVYGLGIDFSPTYPGIAEDFVPPFKACGQNSTGQNYTTVFNASGDGVWWSPFNLTLEVVTPGCDVPCENATLFIDLIASPTAAAVASLNITGSYADVLVALNSTVHNATLDDFLVLNETYDMDMPSLAHFDTKGDYTICFTFTCPGHPAGSCETDPPCVAGAADIIAEGCYDFSVYQWKEAYKVTLDEKWNLISLPLVPLIDPPIEDLLASIVAADRAQIDSIWYYDNCADVAEADKWSMWPGGGLTDLVDGKAYWLKVMPYYQGDCGNITWWLWGTEKPMPPAAPAQYDVCEGWNMVGFLGTAANVSDYLWNWGAPTPVVYGWNHGCFADQTWVLKTASDALELGQGYWMAFAADGAVYVP